MRLFHYTSASKLQNILKDKIIKVAALHVPQGEKPVAWFSFRQAWEPTATPGLLNENGQIKSMTFDEFSKIETPARIEIEPCAAPLDWRAWRKTSGVEPRMAEALARVAWNQGVDVSDWRMSFEPVTLENWLAIELFIHGEWQDASEVFYQPRQKEQVPA